MRPRTIVPLSLSDALNMFLHARGLVGSSRATGGRTSRGLIVTFGAGPTFYQVEVIPRGPVTCGDEDYDDKLYDGFVRKFRNRLRRGDFNFERSVLSRCREVDRSKLTLTQRKKAESEL